MTRKRMYDAIKEKLTEEGLEITEESRAVVEASVCVALEYVYEFAGEVAGELAGAGLYSEAMVAGVFVRKIKGLMK